MSATRDTGEHHKAEQEFRGLLEADPDAMVIVNGRGDIVLVNSQTEKLFGYARTQLLGQTIEMLLPERFRANHAGQCRRYFCDPRSGPWAPAWSSTDCARMAPSFASKSAGIAKMPGIG